MRRVNSSIMLGVMFFFGCGRDDLKTSESTTSEKTGLTLNTATAADGISGRYSEGRETLYFETTRMPRETDDSGKDFDIALRFTDDMGRVVFVLAEGHEIPETWVDDQQIGSTEFEIDEEIYHLASNAAVALTKRSFGDDVRGDVDLLSSQLKAFSAGIDRSALDSGEASRLELDTQLAALRKNVSTRAASLVYSVQGIDSYWKPAFFNGASGEHTATITYRYAYLSGAWRLQTWFVNCNHGTCPGYSPMQYYTTHWGSVSVYAPVTPQVCSGWYGAPHVCNNDTLLQQNNVRYNMTYNTWAGVCSYGLYYRPW